MSEAPLTEIPDKLISVEIEVTDVTLQQTKDLTAVIVETKDLTTNQATTKVATDADQKPISN